MKNMKILEFGEFQLTRAQLQELGEPLTAVIATLSFAINELNVFQLMFLGSQTVDSREECIKAKSSIQMCVIVRTLNGKVFEALKCLDDCNKLINRRGSAEIKSLFEAARGDTSIIEKDQGFTIASRIRSQVTNHYLPSETLKKLENVSPRADHRMFHHEMRGNSFHPIGEDYVFTSEINRLADELAITTGEVIGLWMDWSIEASNRVASSLDQLLVAIVQQRFPDAHMWRKQPYVDQDLIVGSGDYRAPLFMELAKRK